MKKSGLAIASMILGILSILGGALFFLIPLLAVIFGHYSLGNIKKNEMLSGKKMAIAGLTMGWIGLGFWIFRTMYQFAVMVDS